MMRKHIFLSYSRQDKEMMQAIKAAFLSEGLAVWTDEGIKFGTPDWQDAIEKAITDCIAFVCLFSPDAKRSKWVKAELYRASFQKKPIFPILISGDELSAVPLGYEHSQWADLRNANQQLILNRLIIAIKE